MPDTSEMPNPADIPPDRHELLAKIASYYYEANLTQAEIADRLGISRSSVSRLLSEARETGVVDISIRWPHNITADLSAQLAQYYPSTSIHIVRAGGRGYSQVVEALGSVAANLLQDQLKDNDILGISWNTGVYQVVGAFRAAGKLGVTVVQLTGSTGVFNPVIEGPDLARWLAQMLGGQYLYIPAPLVVDSQATRDALLSDHTIAERIEVARQVDIVLLSIGTVFPPLCTLYQLGYLTEDDLTEITRMGGVGEIVSHFYNIEGEMLSLPLHQRIVGLSLEHLRDVDTVIGVAAGKEQAAAIVGALRGSYINTLVLDDSAAEAVMMLTERLMREETR